MNIHETIDAFRRGVLELDCKKIVLRQGKDGGEVYEGPGYIRQTPEGRLMFKHYVIERENVRPTDHFNAQLHAVLGKLHDADRFYELTAVTHDGTTWTATGIIATFAWDTRDDSVIGTGQLQSILAESGCPAKEGHRLRLHFFEEYEVPLHGVSRMEQHGSEYMIRDRAEFEACNCSFEVRMRKGSGDTVIDARSAGIFPPAFEARIQEALQYLTGKSAFWRAKAERSGERNSVSSCFPPGSNPHALSSTRPSQVGRSTFTNTAGRFLAPILPMSWRTPRALIGTRSPIICMTRLRPVQAR
jgi:hypothetical protein